MSTSKRALEAIATITAETGYPPSPEELADVLGVSVRSLHSALISEKRLGRIGYDEHGHFIIRDSYSDGIRAK